MEKINRYIRSQISIEYTHKLTVKPLKKKWFSRALYQNRHAGTKYDSHSPIQSDHGTATVVTQT